MYAIKDVPVVPGLYYFIQVMHVGFLGTLENVDSSMLTLVNGIVFDLRYLVLLGNSVEQIPFKKEEIPIARISSISLHEKLINNNPKGKL